MHRVGYNPCEDTLAGKLWECLRRNGDFREALAQARKHPEKWDEFTTLGYSNAHPSGFVFELLQNGGFPIDEEGTVDPFDENCSWDSTPRDFQVQFADTCDYYLFHVRKDALPSSRARFYITVHIPRVLLNDTHRAEIMAELDDIVPKTSVRALHTKPSNRFLGTQKAWDAFLRYEAWKQSGLARGIACNLVAWERYGKEDFGRTPKGRLERAEVFIPANPKAHKHASTVEKEITTIENAISSVYPGHLPLVSTAP